MATQFYSDQETNRRAIPIVRNTPAGGWGRRRGVFITKTMDSSGLATGDTIDLITLPKGATLLGGSIRSSVANTSATVAIGKVFGDGRFENNRYLTAVTVGTAEVAFGRTYAKKFGDVLTEDSLLIAVNGTTAWSPDGVWQVEIEFLCD